MITPNKNIIFTEVWSEPSEMISDFRASYLNKAAFTDTSLEILYSQLYAKHGSDHIRYSDAEQWKYAVFSIIYNEGVKWQVSRVKQDELENLTDTDILYTGKQITNATQNPSTSDKDMSDTDGLPTIDVQNANIYLVNKIVGYSGYINSLKDVTTEFINKFDKLFSMVVTSPGRVMYANYEDDEEEEE